jgi:hypothetical protein
MRNDWMKAALFAVLISALSAFSGPAACSAGTPKGAQDKYPKAFFPQARHDFGTVMEGQDIRHEFIVENRGQVPLTIVRVQPD